eukprot:GHVR01094541.1.p1 GENE.GHVR01094541.1~~GHVR01094541.1.p1  ORF type:complete len:104 (+),score=48.19 GHVR01094541.1:162-473(+)
MCVCVCVCVCSNIIKCTKCENTLWASHLVSARLIALVERQQRHLQQFQHLVCVCVPVCVSVCVCVWRTFQKLLCFFQLPMLMTNQCVCVCVCVFTERHLCVGL